MNVVSSPFHQLALWFVWQVRTARALWRQRGSGLRIGYCVQHARVRWGRYNTLYPGCRISNVSLGDYTYVGDRSRVQNCRVGKFCSIGPECFIGLGRHPASGFVSTHPVFYSTLGQVSEAFADKDYFREFGDVKIGNDVWIGARVVIADDVCVGDGAIIAAGAVVTKDVEPYAIVGGVPAKFIRWRFSETQIAFLRDLRWWDRDASWLKENFLYFHDIEALLKQYSASSKGG